jgi:hypothetical protein
MEKLFYIGEFAKTCELKSQNFAIITFRILLTH